MFFKINKCIFIGVRMKAFTMQSKNKIGAWAHMRPPFYLCENMYAFRFGRIYYDHVITVIFAKVVYVYISMRKTVKWSFAGKHIELKCKCVFAE